MERANECYQDDFPINEIETWINEFFNQYQPERSKREDFMTYDDYDLKCGCHAEPGVFSRHVDCHLDHKNHIP